METEPAGVTRRARRRPATNISGMSGVAVPPDVMEVRAVHATTLYPGLIVEVPAPIRVAVYLAGLILVNHTTVVLGLCPHDGADAPCQARVHARNALIREGILPGWAERRRS